MKKRMTAWLLALALLAAPLPPAWAAAPAATAESAMPTSPDPDIEGPEDGEGAAEPQTPETAEIAMDTGEGIETLAGNVPLDAAHFPDEVFRSYLKANFDTDHDGALSTAEQAAVTTISVPVYNDGLPKIADMKGIGYFTNLQKLDCTNNLLASLDISQNRKLSVLSCGLNRLAALDVSRNTQLTQLICNENRIAALDLRKNTRLGTLICNSNGLQQLDVSQNTLLTLLICNDNALTKLDVSKNTRLTELDVSRNSLQALDVRRDTALLQLYCSENQLTALDVSKNTRLTELSCYQNRLTKLDVSKNTHLTVLDVSRNGLQALDVRRDTALLRLYCSENQLTELDVSKNIALQDLTCSGNCLTRLDLRKNKELNYLDCQDNQTSATVYDRGQGYQLDLGALVGKADLSRVSGVEGDVGAWVPQTMKNGVVTLERTEDGRLEDIRYLYDTGSSKGAMQVTVHCQDGSADVGTPKLTQAENGAKGIDLGWTAVPGAQNYRIYGKVGSDNWRMLAQTTVCRYTWKEGAPGIAYTFAVCAVRDGACGAMSGTLLEMYLPRPTVAAVNVNSAGTDGVRILATNYADGDTQRSGATLEFFAREQGKSQWQKVGTVSPSWGYSGYSFIWEGGKSGTAYQVTARAVKNTYQSARLEGGKNIRYYRAPDLVSVKKAGGGIQFSWKKQSGVKAYRYQIMIRDNGGAWKPTALVPLSKTSYTWKGAKKGHTYKFSVRFVNSEAAGKPTTNASTAVVSGYNTAGLQIKY